MLPIEARWLGRLDYDTAHEMQIAERDRVHAGASAGSLLLLEHEPVVTFGRRGDLGDLLVPSDTLETRGIAVRATERGGRATYHGPGQLVGYAIAPLWALAPDVPTYVWRLEETLIRVARAVGVTASRRADARGVWVGEAKLGFIGVAISRRVCWHGFSLNVDARPGAWDLIRSCGLDAPTTALADYLDPPTVEDMALLTVEAFASVFGVEVRLRQSAGRPDQGPPGPVSPLPAPAVRDRARQG